MALNYAGSGRVVTLTAPANVSSGQALRVAGLNGVALISASSGTPFTFQVEGIFTLTLAGVVAGALVYINTTTFALSTSSGAGKVIYGRAVTASDSAQRFQCRLQQTTDT